MQKDVSTALKNLFSRREQLVVIGLTGRTGSGCTTVAELLANDFTSLNAPTPINANPSPEQRKYRIVHEYTKKHWEPFFSISISNVIQSFILDIDEGDFKRLISATNAIKDDELKTLTADWCAAKNDWQTAKISIYSPSETIENKAKALGIWRTQLGAFFRHIKTGLSLGATDFLQTIGDNLRKSGGVLNNQHEPSKFYTHLERVVKLIETIELVNKADNRKTLIALDALRNPFEILYFKDRFASFYSIAITTSDEERKSRLTQLGYNIEQIKKLDDKEYPKKSKPLSGYDNFTSQNIQNCLEKADIYINNQGAAHPGQEKDHKSLIEQLVRYVCLMIHPGLVTPTRSERCMQIAFSAKANSGCISRQVGAAITDEHGSIKAIGWNDVPAGQVPCLLRNATDLLSRADDDAFSDYEYSDAEFRQQIEKNFKWFSLEHSQGRMPAFCFRSEYNEKEGTQNQVHTRALHAEENAFLQLSKYGGEGIYLGKLFTTASPCELCAKKAFQLGIREIVYIDPYPGISMKHVLRSGSRESRPEVILFQGAIGSAYHRLYDPILPLKDELSAIMGHEEIIELPPSKPSDQLF